MDLGWRFCFGHPYDADKDFKHGTGYFSYFAKSGYGDGPASPAFDDRAWRVLDLPHDWAIEQPFDSRASHSHGYKAIGRNFPETSVGWYRKTFTIPESDLGRRISIEFDGVHRNAIVWMNGFYLGRESSGYSDFLYDITDYLNYGGDNVIAVRVDVTIEEGWFYEGAGVYRHVWLHKTAPLHVAYHGTFVTSQVNGSSADVTVLTKIINEQKSSARFDLVQQIIDVTGNDVGSTTQENISLAGAQTSEWKQKITIPDPSLWSIDTPYLYKLLTIISVNGTPYDRYETTFGIRTIRFDPDEGFFLNGKHVKLKGTNNHQDHAGVGTAIPDALQEYRITRLKELGSNAYRCAHNPPTPELLVACDRLGMLVIDENRLMGITPEHLDRLKRMILRDRNHPSVILWSLGNEEWAIEGNVKGERITATMQEYGRRLDPTRLFTVASSGGWGAGVSKAADVAGFNYIWHGDTDQHHKRFPNQPGVGTEESTTQGTRGIYEDDISNGRMAPTARGSLGFNVEDGWKYYAERPYLAGLFYWTGFDYRGESNPLNYPAVSSQFGILDLCGFPKESYYYLKAWWSQDPQLFLTPHWNWHGKEGQKIEVWAYSNVDEVELFLNGQNLGRKAMPQNSHLEWAVTYSPGVLQAHGYKDGNEVIVREVSTTGQSAAIVLTADRETIAADGRDVAVLTVQINDAEGRFVPDARDEITFSLQGNGLIIGVGNGDSGCHEADKYFEKIELVRIKNLKISPVASKAPGPEVRPDYDQALWQVFQYQRQQIIFDPDTTIVVRGLFELPALTEDMSVTLYAKSLSMNQGIYVNGHLIAKNIKRESADQIYRLSQNIVTPGKNLYAIIGPPLVKRHQWEELNTDPGIIQVATPTPPWRRSVFNGLAQVIVQSTKEAGKMMLTATSPTLSEGNITIETRRAKNPGPRQLPNDDAK